MFWGLEGEDGVFQAELSLAMPAGALEHKGGNTVFLVKTAR